MAPNLFHPTLFNPFLLWSDLAMKTTEVMVASGQVIGSRMDEATRASANADLGEVKDLPLVETEHVKAAADSGVEAVTRMQAVSLEFMTRTWEHWFTSLCAMATLTGSRSFGEALARQERLFESLRQAAREQPRLRASSEIEDAKPNAARAKSTAHAKRQTGRVSRTRVAASRRRG